MGRPPHSYRDAGVDIKRGNALVERIKAWRRVPCAPGSWAAWAASGPCSAWRGSPFWCPPTDGVGTKQKLALALDGHDTIGIDLVAMCVNDVVVQGAEPLFFLDYFATGRLDVEVATRVIAGIAAGCREARAALVGGETAEMPDLYAAGDYDVAGFCVGLVEGGAVIDGRGVRAGIGVAASGPHANGSSLIRRLIEHREADLAQPFDGRTLAEALLLPTRIYVRPILELIDQIPVRAARAYHRRRALREPPAGDAARYPAPSSTRAPGPARRSSTGSRARVPLPGARCTAPSIAAWALAVVAEPDAARAIGSLSRSGETAWRIGTVVPFTQGHGERVVIEGLPQS